MAWKGIKHRNAAETVGEDVDSLEWASDEIHELTPDSPILCSEPPDGFTQVKNIYLKEIDQEVILIT